MRLHKITLLAALISCIANVSIWAQNTEPNLELEFTTSTFGDYFKTYSPLGSTLSLSSSFTELKGSSDAYYVDMSTSAGSDITKGYVSIKNNELTIDSIALYFSGNGAAKTVTPAVVGWTTSCGTTNASDVIDASITHNSTAGTKVSADWYTYKFDKQSVKELRIYRKAKIAVNGESAKDYGSGETIRLWGIKVWLKPTAPAIASFKVGDVEATINGSTISTELPFGTDLSSITPVVTLGGTATSYTPTGAQDFTNSGITPIVYKAIDGVNADAEYNVSITVAQSASNDAEISSLSLNEKSIEPATIMFDTISYATNVATLPLAITPNDVAATVTVSTDATANAVAGVYSTTVNNPAPGEDLDVVVTVTPQSGAADAVSYTLKIHRKAANIEAAINSITITSPIGTTNTLRSETFVLSNDIYGTTLYPTITASISNLGTYSVERNGDTETVTYYAEADPTNPAGTFSFTYIRQSVLALTEDKAYDAVNLSASEETWNAMVGNCYIGQDASDNPYADYDATGWAAKNENNYWMGLRPATGSTVANIRYVTYRVSNCTQVDVLAFSRSSSNGTKLTVTDEADNSVAGTQSTSDIKVMKTLTVGELDATKTYRITVEGTNAGGNGAYAQLKLKAGDAGPETGIVDTTISGVTYYNGTIYNANRVELQVYNTVGNLVASSMGDIDMSNMSAGIYIVRSSAGTLKIVK